MYVPTRHHTETPPSERWPSSNEWGKWGADPQSDLSEGGRDILYDILYGSMDILYDILYRGRYILYDILYGGRDILYGDNSEESL